MVTIITKWLRFGKICGHGQSIQHWLTETALMDNTFVDALLNVTLNLNHFSHSYRSFVKNILSQKKKDIQTHFKCSIPLSSEGGSNLGRFLMTVCNLSRLQDPSGDIITPFAFPRLPWEQLISWTNKNTIITASHQPNQNEFKAEMLIVHWYQLQTLSYLHWAMKLVLTHLKNISKVMGFCVNFTHSGRFDSSDTNLWSLFTLRYL